MTGEEFSGPPGPKLMRLVYFVGAGGNPISNLSLLFVRKLDQISSLLRTVPVACTVAINKWREFESKSIIQEQQQQKKQGVKVVAEIPNSSESVTIHKALK
jgi:hypothetical protein